MRLVARPRPLARAALRLRCDAAGANSSPPPPPPDGTLLTSPANPFVKHAVRLRDSASARATSGAVLVTGTDLVAECCAAGGGATPRVIVLPEDAPRPPAHPAAPRTLFASPSVLAKLAGVTSADGGVAAAAAAAAVVDAPAPARWLTDPAAPPPRPPSPASPLRVVALDGVQDPGNVGTLARAALALGWDGLLLLPGCADALHPRALRSARGAPFRLPHARATAATDAVALAERLGLTLLAADAAREEGSGGADPLPPLVPPTSNGVCLVLGAERAGVSPALTRAAAGRVTIPMAGAMESLNVGAAGAVLMFALGGGGARELEARVFGEG